MKALITGVTGFVGSHVAERLLQREADVLGVARRRWDQDAPRCLQERVPLLLWDLSAPADEEVARGIRAFAPDLVFHFAGMSLPARCGAESPRPEAIAVNVGGTQRLLAQLATLPRIPRVIFSSTCRVYAPVTADDPVVRESAPCQPDSAYGKTKLMAEQTLNEFASVQGVEVSIVRGFQQIGPRQGDGLMLTDWLGQLKLPRQLLPRQLKTHQQSPLPKQLSSPEQPQPAATTPRRLHVRSTNSYLDLVDVRDAARAYELLAETPSPIRVVNLGSGQCVRSGDVLQSVLDQWGGPLEVVVEDEQPHWNPIADTSILQSLGWAPQIRYEQTIADMMDGRK